MIVFQPASPAGAYPGLEMQVGQGQAAMQGLPTMQRAISDLIQSYAQHGAVQQRAQSDNAALQLRAQEYALGRQDDAARFNAQAQQQADMQAAAQQHQINLLEMEPTQRDMMRRAQLHGALADAQDALAQGAITPEQFETIKANAFGYLAPINQKLATQKIAIEQEQANALKAKNQMMSEIDLANQHFALGHFDQLPLVTNPYTGQQTRMLRNHNGEYYDPFAKSANSSEKLPPGILTEAQFHTHQDRALARAEKSADASIEAAGDKEAGGGWTGAFERAKGRSGVLPYGTYAEYLKASSVTHSTLNPRSSDAPVPSSPADLAQQAFDQAKSVLFGGSPPSAAPSVSPQPRERVPFDWDNPKTPSQVQTRQQFADLSKQIHELSSGMLNGGKRKEYQEIAELIGSSARMVREAGGPEHLAPQQLLQFRANLLEAAKRINEEKRRRAEPLSIDTLPPFIGP